jgi:hypothetical protein
MPPLVAAAFHLCPGLASNSFQDHDMLDGRRIGQRLIDIFFERHNAATTITAIGCDQDLCLGIIDATA